MALTPEQVLNKQFQTTQFRKGYEERDVDDFLDEVVAEMRSLIGQRDDYLKQLNDCRASKNQLAVRAGEASGEAAGSAGPAGPAGSETAPDVAAAQARIEELTASLAEAEARRAEAEAAAAAAAARAAELEAATEPGAGGGQDGPGRAGVGLRQDKAEGDAAAIIALAQRLHDEHVRNGEARRDELVAEAESRHDEMLATGQRQHDELVEAGRQRHEEATRTAEELSASATAERNAMLAAAAAKRDEILTEAKERATGLVTEAEQRKAAVLEELGAQQALLERKVDELRTFERDYRATLRSYLEGQLAELDSSGR